MKAVSPKLEDDFALLPSFVQDEELHLAAWQELEHFNISQTFLHIHPITADRKEYDELSLLYRTDPREFMRRVTNTENNIRRYKSQLKHEKFKDEAQKENWLDYITRDQRSLLLMQSVISNQ